MTTTYPNKEEKDKEDINGITIAITRPVYDFESFGKSFNVQSASKGTPLVGRCVESLRSGLTKRCNGRYIARSLVDRVPVVDHLRRYRWKQDFLLDLMAGVNAGVIHVPQGMGFAMLADLPPVYGLYTSFFPGLLYYLFGTSRHLSIGTMALTAMMVGAVVNRESSLIRDAQHHDTHDRIDVVTAGSSQTTFQVNNAYFDNQEHYLENTTTPWSVDNDDGDVSTKVSIAVSVTLMTGLVQLLMRLFRLGMLSTYMSVPFSGSFMVGAAVQIVVSQLPFQLGISIQRQPATFQLPLTLYELFRNIAKANACAVVASVICVIFLVGMKEGVNERLKGKLKFPIPVELIVVIIATLVSHFAQLKSRFHLPVIGSIPVGFPTPTAPTMPHFTGYLTDAVMLAMISFAVAITMAQFLGRRHQYEVDTNQETLAYGIVNTVSSFFGCFVSTQGPSRTMVHETAGGRTQMAGFLSIILPLLVMLWIGPLFQSLPTSVLGCIVSCSLVPLLKQFADLRLLWKVNKYDFLVWMITFLSTSMVSVTVGLIVGIIVSIFFIALQAQLAKGFRIIPAKNTEIYYRSPSGNENHNQSLEKEFLQSGIRVFRYNCGEICFVNAENIKRFLYQEIGLKQMIIARKNDEKKIADSLNKVEISGGNDDKKQAPLISNSSDENGYQNDGDKMLNNNEEHPLKGEANKATETTDSNEQDNSDGVQSVLLGESSSSSSSSPLSSSCEYVAYDRSEPRHLILDLATVCYLDITGLNSIKQIAGDCNAAGVELAFVVCNQRLSHQLNVFGLLTGTSNQEHGGAKVYPTVHDAVIAAAHA